MINSVLFKSVVPTAVAIGALCVGSRAAEAADYTQTNLHQTGRADYPHPAFRLASWRGFRRGVGMVFPERDDFQFAVNG